MPSSDWTGENGWMFITVDISACGFISTPIITASVEGAGGFHSYMVGASAVQAATKEGFGMRLEGMVTTAFSPAQGYRPPLGGGAEKWNVNWIAAGYTC